MRLGIHLPNRPLREGEEQAIAAVGCTDYLVYDAGDWAVDQVRRIQKVQPAARFHYRGEARGALGDPTAEAAAVNIRLRRFPVIWASVRHRNEPNLESPSISPQAWAWWLLAFVRAFQALSGTRALFLPALSPTGDWEAWLRALLPLEALGVGLDLHAYGFPDEVQAIVQRTRALWPGEIIVTETNQGAGRVVDMDQYTARLPDVVRVFREARAEAVFWFIWDWERPDMALPQPVSLAQLPALREAWGRLAQEVRQMDWQPVDLRQSLPRRGEYERRDLSRVWGITIHYTAGPSTQTPADVAAYQISPAAASQTGAGVPFPGLAYHLIVQVDGTVGLANDLDRRTWHNAARDPQTSEPRNLTHIGICYIGDTAPTDAQMEGLARAVVWCERQLGRPLSIEGHKDLYPTACPGPTWPAWKSDLLSFIERFRQGEKMDDVQKQQVLDHLNILWGYMRVVQQAGETLQSAVLLEAAKAFAERIAALKRDLGLG